MDNQTSNEINMIRSADNVLHKYSTRYASLTAMGNYVTALDGVIIAIDAQESIVNGITTGQTTDKSNKCLAMVTVALIVAGAGYSYAIDTGDDILLKKMSLTKSDFARKVDGDDASLADMVYNTLNPIVASLADYNITSAIMTDFLGKITAYRAVLESAHTNIQAGKDARAAVKKQVKIGIAILDKTDKLMLQFDTATDEDFYDAYTDSREIYDMGKGHKTVELAFEPNQNIAQTIFEGKFKGGDSLLFRNKSEEDMEVGLTDQEGKAPITDVALIKAKTDVVVVLAKDANVLQCKWVSIVALNKFAKAVCTVFLIKGKSHSKASSVELVGSIKG